MSDPGQSRHLTASRLFPVFPRKRTLSHLVRMSRTNLLRCSNMTVFGEMHLSVAAG
jgi:hypothetical protein